MNDWSILSTRKPRGFIVNNPAGTTLATLRFPSWFSQCAEATLPTGSLEIRRRKWWSGTYQAHQNGAVVCTISQKWGAMRLSLTDGDGPGVELWLAHKGWWKGRYELSVPKGPILLSLEPRGGFSWEMDMAVRLVGAGIAQEQLPMIITVAAFTVRVMRSQAAAATTTAVG